MIRPTSASLPFLSPASGSGGLQRQKGTGRREFSGMTCLMAKQRESICFSEKECRKKPVDARH